MRIWSFLCKVRNIRIKFIIIIIIIIIIITYIPGLYYIAGNLVVLCALSP